MNNLCTSYISRKMHDIVNSLSSIELSKEGRGGGAQILIPNL